MKKNLWLFFAVLVLLGGCALFGPQESPTALVEQFLALEQQGDYGSAWEKLHPEVQHIWPKERYIQQRAKIFMDVMGARTFTFEIGDIQTLDEWISPMTGTTYTNVHLVPTKLTFSSPFGTVSLLQNYYVIQNNGQHAILWDIRPDAPRPSFADPAE
ncbi:MAG: hypothetical protein A6D91_04340 [Bacillaceae bacterium G1]|nr:hypothetical protein [Bacillota bacterium]OJF17131.1 MAG: hypothetical protein A6D91_04340 [Bacillaceae bacterium G1]